MSDKVIRIVPQALERPSTEQLLTAICQLTGDVTVRHHRSDEKPYTASSMFKGQYLSASGPTPWDALWTLGKLLQALR